MRLTVQPYIILSLLAAFSFAFSGLSRKFASKHKFTSPWKMLFYTNMTYLPFLFLIPLVFSITFPTSSWFYIFLSSFMFLLGGIFFTHALFKLDASTFAPFFQLQSAFIAILAFIFLKERFPMENYFFILLMIAGSVLVSINEKMSIKTYFTLGTFLIIIQQLFHALSNLFAGFALKDIDSFSFIFWMGLVAAFMTILIFPMIKKSERKASLTQLKPLFVAGFFSVIGATSLFTAFETNLTISSALSLLTAPIVLLITFFASIFKPNLLEHHTKKVYVVRTIGVVIILISALKLSIG